MGDWFLLLRVRQCFSREDRASVHYEFRRLFQTHVVLCSGWSIEKKQQKIRTDVRSTTTWPIYKNHIYIHHCRSYLNSSFCHGNYVTWNNFQLNHTLRRKQVPSPKRWEAYCCFWSWISPKTNYQVRYCMGIGQYCSFSEPYGNLRMCQAYGYLHAPCNTYYSCVL